MITALWRRNASTELVEGRIPAFPNSLQPSVYPPE